MNLTNSHLYPRTIQLLAFCSVIRKFGSEANCRRFTWGSGSLYSAGELRQRYIAALHSADNRELAPLVAFARS